jgi:NDP-sugar pyrophosphorylase family protein
MSANLVPLDTFIAGFAASPLAGRGPSVPWELTQQSEAVVRHLLDTLADSEFIISGEVAVHVTAIVEAGATIKGPLILGARCFVASGAYLRGGNWLAEGCTLGPGSELKSSFVFPGTVLAHFNFVGDSILGAGVNLEAGSIICNHRNERANNEIYVRTGGALQPTGCHKFGAVVGDRCRIGANAVLAPGALLPPWSIVPRASLRDDELSADEAP